MTNAKIFRLFISSTFKDFQQERQVLHEKVFPIIENYCLEQGYQFQAIDLRWGVSEEAQLNQKTLELCLNEVRVSKHFPHPNFLIMAGNRYGWIPLPYAIEFNEYSSILEFYTSDKKSQEILNKWYKEDTNHLLLNNTSHAYVLKERNPGSPYKNFEEWEKEENQLRNILQAAVKKLFYEDKTKCNKYFLSATEAEVEEGIFEYLNPTSSQKILQQEQTKLKELDKEYILGYFRDITNIDNLNASQETTNIFADEDQTRANRFKKEVSNVLNKENQLHITAELSTNMGKPFIKDSYLDKFEKFMIDKLKLAIHKQIQNVKEVLPIEQELLEQQKFKSLKIDTFFGRENELKIVKEYISGTSSQVFIVHGISGIGKSSFVAKTIDTIENYLTYKLVYKFIGATAYSSNIRTLLESMIIDLAQRELCILPAKFEIDCNKFNEQVRGLIESITEPTIIILDALDQLQYRDYLQWLPIKLQDNLKIILSMLDEEGYKHYYDLLKDKVNKTNQIKIQPIGEKVAVKILDELLKKEKRALTPNQHKYVLEQLNKSDNSPLYLKLAFIEVLTWKSTDQNNMLKVGIQGIIKEFIDNLTDKFHHNKYIVHKVLGLISASKDGLSEKELLDLLSRDEEILQSLEKFNNITLNIDDKTVRRFPISVWARLLEHLKPFLNERNIDGQNLITFFHSRIALTVKDYIYEPNKKALHAELANYFLTLQDRTKLWDKRYYNLHMLRETPFQLYNAMDARKLKKILFNLEFAGSVYNNSQQHEFIEILEKASFLIDITENELFPWKSFYKENNHLLTRMNTDIWKSHQSLFQLAYEDGLNSPLTHESKKLLKSNKINFDYLELKNVKQKYLRINFEYILLDGKYQLHSLKENKLFLYSYNTILVVDIFGNVISEIYHSSVSDFYTRINNIKILQNNNILSYTLNNEIRFFSSNGKFIKKIIIKNKIKGLLELSDETILIYTHEGFIHKINKLYNITSFKAHENSINGLVQLSDDFFISYSEDTTLKVWHVEDECFSIFLGHKAGVNGLIVLDDGNILSYSKDGTLKLWNFYGEMYESFELHTDEIVGIIQQENNIIISYSMDSRIIKWDLRNPLLTWIMEGHTSCIDNILLLDNGNLLSISQDKTFKIWNQKNKCIKTEEIEVSFLNGIKQLNNSNIALYFSSGDLKIIDNSGNVINHFKDNNSINNLVEYKLNKLVTFSDNIKVWNISILNQPEYQNEYFINSILILKNYEIVSFSNDGYIKIFNDSGSVLKKVHAHKVWIRNLIELDNHIFSYDIDGNCKLWNSQYELLKSYDNFTCSGDVIKLNSGQLLLKTTDNELIYIDASGNIIRKQNDDLNINFSFIRNVLKNGNIIAYEYEDIKIIDENWNIIFTIKIENNIIYSEDYELLDESFIYFRNIFELNNENLMGYTDDGQIFIWNPYGIVEHTFKIHMKKIRSIQELNNNLFLAYSAKGEFYIFNSFGEILQIFSGHNDVVYNVKIFDNKIVSASEDSTLKVWDFNGHLLQTYYLAKEFVSFHLDKYPDIIVNNGNNLNVYKSNNF